MEKKNRYSVFKLLWVAQLALLLLCGAAPLWAAPEPGRMYKIGVLWITDNETMDEGFSGVRRGLAKRGYVKGKNMRLYKRIVLGDPTGL